LALVLAFIRLLLAALFVTAGVSKLRSPARTRQTIQDFGVSSKWLVAGVAYLLPIIEIVSGLSLLWDKTLLTGSIAVAVMLIVFSVANELDLLVYAGFLLMGIGWGGLLPLQEVIWVTFFGRRYFGSVRSTAMPFTFGMSALGPVLVAYYYDLVGNYDLALLVIALCNISSAIMLYRMKSKPVSQKP